MSLSVLIVDDERWMRDTIAKSIDWDQYGLRVVGKANDGLQAYDMILQLKPHIVLADIKMPGMDGITLLRRLKENGIDLAFIFFSGYDSFEYAKDAINLGALGYILKPVDERELLTLLLKAKQHIEYERQRGEEKDHFTDLSDRERDRKKSEYISRMLDGIVFEEESLQRAGLEFISDCFVVVSIEIDKLTSLQKDIVFDKCSKLKLSLSTMCIDYFETTEINVFSVNSQKGITILINKKSSFEKSDWEKMTETCKRIINMFKINIGNSITIGIGNVVNGKERIQESYMTSIKALEYKLLAGIGEVIYYNDVYESKISTVMFDNLMEKEIVDSFEKSDFNLSDRIIDRIKAFRLVSMLSIDDIKKFNYSLIEFVYRLMNKSDIQTLSYCNNTHLVYDDMNKSEDMEELFKKYAKFINESLQLVSERSLNYYKKLADKIKKYIQEHYTENISLEDIAQELAFHPNYISRIFKEEFSENFIDYLTNYRITESKALLREDIRHNVADIAIKVGYSNPKYFSKVFKKVVGVTPMEYIQNKK